MPFASGTFTLSAGNPVTTLTTISSSWANTTLSDIATGLSTAVLKDGTQTLTSNLPMSSFKLTGLGAGSTNGDSLRYEQVFTTATGTLSLLGSLSVSSGLFVSGVVSASGAINMVQAALLTATSTVAIGASTGNYAVVTGTATVSSFDTIRAGALRIVEWSGVTPLTNSANLILQKGASLTTVTGQASIFVSEGGGTWRLVSHFPPKTPTQQIFLSGSGTYTTPTGATRLHTRMVGGGGGGGGTNTAGAAAGSTGGSTTFSTFTAAGGVGGGLGNGASTGAGGAGGAASGGTLNINGTPGGGTGATQGDAGGNGGATAFGGAAGGGQAQTQNGNAGAANTGGGGGGGAGTGAATFGAGGGGSGAYVESWITSPAATYSYAVGALGAGGTGNGQANGGNGGSGLIIVEEFYD